MSKLTLDLNALEVQSFVTDDAAARLFGTVHARQHKGHTGQQDTDCSAVDACRSAMIECSDPGPCETKNGCQSKDPCSDLVACSQIGCSEHRCPTSHECTKDHHHCDPSREHPCISERECTQVCPRQA